jgi:hypothetical protein
VKTGGGSGGAVTGKPASGEPDTSRSCHESDGPGASSFTATTAAPETSIDHVFETSGAGDAVRRRNVEPAHQESGRIQAFPAKLL